MIFIIIFLFQISYSQDLIMGNVYIRNEKGEKIIQPGVNVQWLGTNIGGKSNSRGHFMFKNSEESDMLIFSFVGYKKDTIHVHDKSEFLEVILTPDENITSEIEVTADSPDKIYNSSISHTETITRKALSKLACCNLSEAFLSDPSVDIQFTDPATGSKKMNLLGLDGKYAQIMIEKIPYLRGLNIPYGLSFVPGPWIESIDISKGIASVSTGFESITGQVNVELKKPNGDESLVNLFVDGNNRAELNGILSKEINDNLSSIYMINSNFIFGQFDGNNDGLIDRPETKHLNFMGKYLYNSDNLEIQSGTRILSDSKIGRFPFVASNPFSLDNLRAEFFAKGGILNDDFNLAFIVNYNYQNNITSSIIGDKQNDFNLKQNSFLFNALSDFEIFVGLPFVLSTGYSMVYDKFEVSNVFDLVENQNNKDYLTNGIFSELKYSESDHFNFSLGLRVDYNELNNIFFTPRAHIKITPFEDLDIRITAGKGYRYSNPVFENIYLFLFQQNIESAVNFNQVKMEQAYNYGSNINYFFEILGTKNSINLEYYNTIFENRVIVDFYNYSQISDIVYENNKKSYSESFGIDLNLGLSDYVEINTSIRKINSFFTNQFDEFIREPLMSYFKSNNTLNLDLNDWGVTLRYTLTYYGSGKRTTLDNQNNFSEFNPFILHSGQINKKFNDLGLEIYIGSENISSYSILSDGANFNSIGANYLGTDLWGPVMGINTYFGINWEM